MAGTLAEAKDVGSLRAGTRRGPHNCCFWVMAKGNAWRCFLGAWAMFWMTYCCSSWGKSFEESGEKFGDGVGERASSKRRGRSSLGYTESASRSLQRSTGDAGNAASAHSRMVERGRCFVILEYCSETMGRCFCSDAAQPGHPGRWVMEVPPRSTWLKQSSSAPAMTIGGWSSHLSSG